MNLFEDTYFTINKPSEGIFRDRGSKFLGFAYPVKSEEEVKQHIQHLKKEHFSARHHCYAFRIGPDKQFFRANDDGEPSGTAGRPILGQIQSKDLTNTLIVVVRYFGGTLLGVGGLINAYKLAASDAIAHAQIVELTVNEYYHISFGYDHMNEVMKIIKDNELVQSKQDFGLDCSLEVSVRKGDTDRVIGLFRKVNDVKVDYLKTE